MKSKIYKGLIKHNRYLPVAHSFSYSLYVYAIDIDELPELDRRLPLFGYNRLRFASIFDRDYLLREKGSIREKLVRCLELEGIISRPGRVILITSPRYLNYVFNPVSFYYCYTPQDTLLCIISEVNNTYGERHLYVLKDSIPESEVDFVSYKTPKAFHVSPFNRIEGEYEFSFSKPEETLDITIKLNREGKDIFEANLTGNAVELNPINHMKIMFKNPLIPHLSIPRIYWEAFMLYFKRKMQFYDKPVPISPKTMVREKPTFFQGIARDVVFSHFKRISSGQIRMLLPGNKEKIFGHRQSSLKGEVDIKDFQFFSRTMLNGEIGLGESYTAGEWDSSDLVSFLEVLIENRDVLSEGNWITSTFSDWAANVKHSFRENKISASRKNISQHYDLGNDFFKLFLDRTMTYSCAFFKYKDETLEDAQKNKYQQIIAKADIKKNDHVLEIGCGWGGFALEAVKTTDCRITAVTVSEEQYRFVKEIVSKEGLSDKIQIRLQDYREIKGQFDKIVSIEMLEAVGHKYFGHFFRICDRLLKKNGVIVVQTITTPDQEYQKKYKKSDWIKKHIFPGGQLPSLTTICNAMTRYSSLIIESAENIGDHYALTLNKWRQAFNENEEQLRKMNLDKDLSRKWNYYLALCEAAFLKRALGDLQLVLTRQNNSNLTKIFR
jgi:cyclopropane-fatty-acyl-phospholipid synthase